MKRTPMSFELATDLYEDAVRFSETGVLGKCEFRTIAEETHTICSAGALMDLASEVFRTIAAHFMHS